MLEAVHTLCKPIAEAADRIDAERGIPEPLVQQLRDAGLCRALIPHAYGGGEVEFEDHLAAIEAMARADASTAWCVNQAAVIGITSLWLPETSIREIWSDPNTSVANGPPIDCQIAPAGEQFLLNGHWGFSSGCQHANWMMGAARFTPGGWRIAYFRPQQVEFTDTWQVAGLRGTGSFEFRAKDVALDAAYVTDMGAAPTHVCDLTIVPSALLFATSFAALTVGLAGQALQDIIDIARDKKPLYGSSIVKDDPDAQRFLGKAMARWRGARTYLYGTVAEVLAAVRSTGEISHDQRASLRMAGTHVIQENAQVVDLAYKIAGSTAIYQHQTLQRRFQDMHVITQHVQGRETYFGLLGRYFLTGDYETGPMT